MKNKIEDLRNHLFATIEALRDEDRPMDVERARAIGEVASVIISSAKVEVQYLAANGGRGTGFLPHEQADTHVTVATRPRLAR
jgi:hypothetical protein